MKRPYSITLTNSELGSLAWMAEHGYFPRWSPLGTKSYPPAVLS